MTKTAEKLDQETIEGITPYSGELVPLPQAVPTVPVQRVQSQYTTAVAVQKPRQLTVVTNNVLKEAELAGAAFYFRWEVWNKAKKKMVPIQGGSIDLAMCIARNYGNCVIDIDVEELPSHWVFRAVFIDLETGFSFPRVYRQRRTQDLGKMDDDRAQDMTFQIGQSKAQRNAVLKAVPGWLIDQAIEVARTAEIGKIKTENIVLARAKVVDFFDKYGVEVEALEVKTGRAADMWTAEDIAYFRSTATAIKEGQVSAKEVFGDSERALAESKTQEKIDALKGNTIDPEREKAARSSFVAATLAEELDRTEKTIPEKPVGTGEPEDLKASAEHSKTIEKPITGEQLDDAVGMTKLSGHAETEAPLSTDWDGILPDDMPAGPPLWKEANYKGRRTGNGKTTGLAGWVNRNRHILFKAPNEDLAKILTKWPTYYKTPFPTLGPLNPDQDQGKDEKNATSSSGPVPDYTEPLSSPPWDQKTPQDMGVDLNPNTGPPTKPTVNQTGLPLTDAALDALGPEGPEIYEQAKKDLAFPDGPYTSMMDKAIASRMSTIADRANR